MPKHFIIGREHVRDKLEASVFPPYHHLAYFVSNYRLRSLSPLKVDDN